MLSLGFIKDYSQKAVLSDNQIELILGDVGRGKSFALALLLKRFKNNALIFSNGGCDKTLLVNSIFITLSKDTFKSDIKHAINYLKKYTVVLETNETDEKWFKDALNYITLELKNYFLSNNNGFLALDSIEMNYDSLVEICDSGTMVKVSTQYLSSYYDDFYTKFPDKLVKTQLNFTKRIDVLDFI